MALSFDLDGTTLTEGSIVFDITMGQGRIIRVAEDYLEVSYLNQSRVIYDYRGCVAGQRRLFTVPPALISFENTSQRTLALAILALLGVTLR